MGPPAKPVDAPSADSFPADSSGVPSEDMRVPSLHDLGYQDEMIPATCPFPGGETEGYRRLKEHMTRCVVYRRTRETLMIQRLKPFEMFERRDSTTRNA